VYVYVCECDLLFLSFQMGMLFNLKMVTWWRLLWKETRLGLSLTGSVSQEDGELFAVDAINSNIVWITPPLSQCMVALVLLRFSNCYKQI